MEIRENMIKQFNRFLDLDQSKELEENIFNYISEESITNGYVSDIKNNNFEMFYKNKCNSLIINLDPNSYVKNNYLLNKLKNKEIKIKDMLKFNHQNFFPDNWEKNIKIQELLDKEISADNNQSVTNLFKCRYCIKRGIKKPTCTYVSVQTRSADEPATNFVTCVECNKSWRD